MSADLPGSGRIHDEANNRPIFRRGLWLAVAVALLARGAIQARGFGQLDDPDNYLVLARSLAEGHGYVWKARPTAYRPPLYPLILTPLVKTLGDRLAWGVAGLHLALGAGTVVLTALAARRWGLADGPALASAFLVACDPVLVAQARPVMTETLSAFLIAATTAALTLPGWRGELLGGLGFGLSTLSRPSLLAGAGLTTLAAALTGQGTLRDRLRRALVLAGATIVTLLPWAVRNTLVFGEPVWTTTHGGYTLALANNPVYYNEVLNGPPGAVWSGPNQERWFKWINQGPRGLSEPQADRWMRAQGLRMIREQPRNFARACLARQMRFWGVAPAGAVYPRWLRLATLVWTVPFWIALAVGASRMFVWQWPRIAAPLMIVALAMVHLVYWTDLRMRAPIVPCLALTAACAWPGRVHHEGARIPQRRV